MKRKATTYQNKQYKKPRAIQQQRAPMYRAPAQRAPASLTIPRHTPEVKVLDCSSGSANLPNGNILFNTTGQVMFLNAIQTGSTFCNRVGRRITFKSLRFTGHMDVGSGGALTTNGDIGHFMIVYDRQPNGALPSVQTILQQTDQATTNTTTAACGLNMNNRERFETIVDCKISFPQVAMAGGLFTSMLPQVGPTIHCSSGCHLSMIIDEFRKLKNHVSHYQADSNPAVIGDISTGAFYIVTFANENAVGGFLIGDWSCRMKFYDA